MDDRPSGPPETEIATLLEQENEADVVAALERLSTADQATKQACLGSLKAAADDRPELFDGVLPPLTELLQDSERPTRLTTAKLFVTISEGAPDNVVPIVPTLAERLADESRFYYVRARCAEALGYVAVDHPDAVVSHLYDSYPGGHAYSDIEISRSGEETPVPWVLGSSPSSAALAGELGLRYCFAAFIRPRVATRSFEEYRNHFESSQLAGSVDKPQSIVAVNAVCAETDAEAARLRAVAEASFKRMERGVVGTTPAVEEAIDELGAVPEPMPATLDTGEWPRAISGSPETLNDLLKQLSDRVGVDEVMIQHVVGDHADALCSHKLLANGAGLTPR